MISRGVVDDHNMVVSIVLHDNRLDIVDVTAISCVIEGGNHYAEGQFCVPTDLILFLVVEILLIG